MTEKAEKKGYVPINLPEGYEPSELEEYMNDMQKEYFFRKLQQWKKDLYSESEGIVGDLTNVRFADAELGDRVSGEAQTYFRLRQAQRYRKLIKKIDYAIERIENGSYGYCAKTGEEIGLERLKARPVATLSIEAQERREKDEKR
ncbi:RNA polymerase-binding protein DksA [Candidatus Sneabacter namystus]|uniref:RNA polymerase-binding protein DksA n=1 Tax=Candidatus Sneabacter namystus TaxID=2601646 RepID=A0A5C0UHS5_9RICK|nr:RNA polymerase-binding protein DksA [Candidatus Sneabacter namystus]QEK39596.1 RNA polymerase-binding protein DksA [Candidatus Sneabacter namystus]